MRDAPLASFIGDLSSHRRQRALAAMIDIYPDGPIGSSSPHVPPEAPPTRFCPLYDGDGYRLGNEKFCTAVRGGPRFRLFGADMRLTKFPVLFVDRETQFNGGSNHAPLPFRRNFSPVHAVLLHYKFPNDAVAEFRNIARDGNHAGGSRFYKMIVGHDDFHQETVLRYSGSRTFDTSEAMVEGGFMQDLRGSQLRTRSARQSSSGRSISSAWAGTSPRNHRRWRSLRPCQCRMRGFSSPSSAAELALLAILSLIFWLRTLYSKGSEWRRTSLSQRAIRKEAWSWPPVSFSYR